jgi:hypothetical protein
MDAVMGVENNASALAHSSGCRKLQYIDGMRHPPTRLCCLAAAALAARRLISLLLIQA